MNENKNLFYGKKSRYIWIAKIIKYLQRMFRCYWYNPVFEKWILYWNNLTFSLCLHVPFAFLAIYRLFGLLVQFECMFSKASKCSNPLLLLSKFTEYTSFVDFALYILNHNKRFLIVLSIILLCPKLETGIV